MTQREGWEIRREVSHPKFKVGGCAWGDHLDLLGSGGIVKRLGRIGERDAADEDVVYDGAIIKELSSDRTRFRKVGGGEHTVTKKAKKE